MAARRRPSVLARRPVAASSARKAHSDSAEAGSAFKPRAWHHASKIRQSLSYAALVAGALLFLAKSAARSRVAVSSTGGDDCSMMASVVMLVNLRERLDVCRQITYRICYTLSSSKEATHNMTYEKKLQFNMRMSPIFKAMAEKAAAADRRSLASLIEKLLADYCQEKGFHEEAPKKGRRR